MSYENIGSANGGGNDLNPHKLKNEILEPIQKAIKLTFEGQRSIEEWEAFVKGVNPFTVNVNSANQIMMDEAQFVLGSEKIISSKQYAKAWKLDKIEELPIRYSINTLRQAARENIRGLADWYLIYLRGISVLSQCRLVYNSRYHGYYYVFTARNAAINYYEDEIKAWRKKGVANPWMTISHNPNYHLINTKKCFAGQNWDQLTKSIRKIKHIDCCFEEIVSEAALTLRFLDIAAVCSDLRHPGRFHNIRGNRVIVRNNFYDGTRKKFERILVSGNSYDSTGALLFWKFDF